MKSSPQTLELNAANAKLNAALLQAKQLASELEIHRKELDFKTQQLKEQQALNDKLTYENAYLKRMRYGVKSESLSSEQRDLFNEYTDEDIAAVECEIEQLQTQATARKPKTGAGRQPLPAHLPRTVIIHEPESCHCPQCKSQLIKFGEDISEKLHYTPGTFSVEQHIRSKYKCPSKCEGIISAPVEPAIIDGGMATNDLLAWVIISKYLDHLPLYRIEQIAQRQGVNLPRQTLAQWVGKVGVALAPLAQRLRELMLQSTVLHADETPIRQLNPGTGKTHAAYLWAYRTASTAGHSPPIILFDHQSSRAGKHARQFLDSWRGHLMVDDYAGYKALFNNGNSDGAIKELACWAHARRKFHDLHVANGSPVAHEALTRIGQLYAIERQGSELNGQARYQLRQTQAVPILNDLHAWLTSLATVGGTALQKAINYTLKRWAALTRYVESGQYPIDNNPIENAIRPIAIGKKNWLFVGSERAGQRAAAIQSLLATAKANGIEPHAWLIDTLNKLPTWKNSRIDDLLPLRCQDGGM